MIVHILIKSGGFKLDDHLIEMQLFDCIDY